MTAIPYDQAKKILTSRFQSCTDTEISMWIKRNELLAYVDLELTEQYIPESPFHSKFSHSDLYFDAEGIESFNPSNRSGISGLAMGLYKEAGDTRDMLAKALEKNSEDQSDRTKEGSAALAGPKFKNRSTMDDLARAMKARLELRFKETGTTLDHSALFHDFLKHPDMKFDIASDPENQVLIYDGREVNKEAFQQRYKRLVMTDVKN